jgi:predicted adenine nucleotide alpha hydrolase (AANH) superfamily ATPase
MMKPRLVLHICCAPDEAWVIKVLGQSYSLYSFFCNPNISPEDEYCKRLDEAQRVAARFGIEFAADPYDTQSWEDAVHDWEATPEGGARCEACFLLRLRRTALFCKEIGWETFATVMSVSPHKNVQMLNEAGTRAALENGVKFESFDFKKKDGFRKSVLFSQELGLYRQDYCGCRLSKNERDRRNANKGIRDN